MRPQWVTIAASGEALFAGVGKGTPRFELVPVYLEDTSGAPRIVDGDEGAVILSRVRSLSANLGTTLSVEGNRLVFGP